MPLAPTLWRTCRVLANPVRLAFLRAVADRPGSTVSELARRAGLPLPTASLYLRQLQARGLLRPVRTGAWVRYSALADPAVSHASAVLAAATRDLRRARPPYRRLVRTLTGFTHPRRLILLRAIATNRATTAGALRAFTRIPASALFRHLDKLQRHGLIDTEAGAWRIAARLTPLARALLDEAAGPAPRP